MNNNARSAAINKLISRPPAENMVEALVRESVNTQKTNAASKLEELRSTQPINTRGGFQEKLIDLSDAAFNSDGVMPLGAEGFGIIMPWQGNVAGAVLDFDFDGGGRVTTVLPGAAYYGHFTKCAIRRNSASTATGLVRVLVLLQPDIDYKELPPSPLVGNSAAPTALGGADGDFAVPTLSTEGVTISGEQYARCVIAARVGQTITALTQVNVWIFDPTVNLWALGEVSHSFSTLGTRALVCGVDTLGVPIGRIYYQPIGLVTSGAGGADVYVRTWGI